MRLFEFIPPRAIASAFPTGRYWDAVSILSRLFPALAVAAGAAGPRNGIPPANLGGRDGMPVQAPAMNTENSGEALASGRHTHESKSPEPVLKTVFHHIHCLNQAKQFENLTKIALRDIPGQVGYADIHSGPLSSVSDMCLLKACQTNRNGSGDGS
jgi:hypothetical protein